MTPPPPVAAVFGKLGGAAHHAPQLARDPRIEDGEDAERVATEQLP
jgi:hypothetical protein